MIKRPVTRRTAVRFAAGMATVGAFGMPPIQAADKSVTVGLDLSLTGADAESAKRVEYGAMMAFDEANAKGGVNGYKIVVTPYDDGTATAGQYDPAQAATNARKMVSDTDHRRGDRPANERRRQGDGADPQRGRSRHHHAQLDQSGHHRSEVRRPVPAGRQGDLLPHRHHRRLPGPEHGQLLRRRAAREDGLHSG